MNRQVAKVGEKPSPEFGQFLKKCREKVPLSQSKLAEACDFDHSYISRLESGNRMPTREAVLLLGKAMGLQPGSDHFEILLDLAGFRTVNGAFVATCPEIRELNNLYSVVGSGTQEEIRTSLRLLNEALEYRRIHRISAGGTEGT